MTTPESESILTVDKSERSIWIKIWTKVRVLKQTERANKKKKKAGFKGKMLAIAEKENLINLCSFKIR